MKYPELIEACDDITTFTRPPSPYATAYLVDMITDVLGKPSLGYDSEQFTDSLKKSAHTLDNELYRRMINRHGYATRDMDATNMMYTVSVYGKDQGIAHKVYAGIHKDPKVAMAIACIHFFSEDDGVA